MHVRINQHNVSQYPISYGPMHIVKMGGIKQHTFRGVVPSSCIGCRATNYLNPFSLQNPGRGATGEPAGTGVHGGDRVCGARRSPGRGARCEIGAVIHGGDRERGPRGIP